ncbi:MAG TPA: DUF1254 domain-containing protein [Ktedonobacterales bacterium]|nr:DUF1254 domain-containing protein [Ktedonobacterales bacterium]
MSEMSEMGQQAEPPQIAPLAALAIEEARALAEEAYIFGYPLVLMDVTREVMTATARAGDHRAPLNQFAHLRSFPDPASTGLVSPNADTLSSSAWLDVAREPVVLSLPDMGGRYYMVSMLDGWTDVFAAPGARTTGSGAGNYAITWPGWRGTLPAGMRMVTTPTAMVWLVGRIRASGPSDYLAVRTLQDRFRLTPLSAWGTPYIPPTNTPIAANVNLWDPPVDQVGRMDAMTFFSRLNTLLVTNPPSAADAPLMERITRIGVAPGVSEDHARLDQMIAGAVRDGMEAARETIAASARALGDTVVNGWVIPSGLGRYGTHYLKRAAVALFGLGANLPEDAIYPTARVDGDGQPLSGQRRYCLHFEPGKLPPINEFWSLTMYNERQSFVENPLDRYAIGDRDELWLNADGSLDLYIQHDAPGGDREANWLPAPEGSFNLTLGLYWPKPAILEGHWAPPPLQRLG